MPKLCLSRRIKSVFMPDGAWVQAAVALFLMLSLAVTPALAGPDSEPPAAPGKNNEESESGSTIDVDALGEGISDKIEVTDVRNVSYFDGLLSVDFRDQPAEEALSEIARLTGFTLKIDEATRNRRLSVRFRDQPLEKALNRVIRLLQAENFRFTYDKNGRVSEVIIQSGPQTVTSPSASKPPARGSAVSTPPPDAAARRRPSSRRRRVRPRNP